MAVVATVIAAIVILAVVVVVVFIVIAAVVVVDVYVVVVVAVAVVEKSTVTLCPAELIRRLAKNSCFRATHLFPTNVKMRNVFFKQKKRIVASICFDI